MTEPREDRDGSDPRGDAFDVVIVGAGVSGLGAAYHLKTHCPWARYVIIEAQRTFGGMWVTHRYPGVRSDTDLYTYGYSFKPWTGVPIATGSEILEYLSEVIDENGLGAHIRYGHRVSRASWSSGDRCWSIDAAERETGHPLRLTARFLFMCQGYIRHDQGYTPDWPGLADFEGRLVHPQAWPDDLDYEGQQVVIVGSGATAATLVPAMADGCARLTLLQRSPTYYLARKNVDQLVADLRAIGTDESWIHEIARRKVVFDVTNFTRRCVAEPDAVKQELIDGVAALLGPGYDVATHFTPRYRPWQQRLAYVPDGDFFRAIARGSVEIVTDEISRFTPRGLLLASGRALDADVIVTATGLNLCLMGDVAFEIDGVATAASDFVTYRGMMFESVPNLAWVFGYLRAGWTLRVDLISQFVCRLLNHMHMNRHASVTPRFRSSERGMPALPFVDPDEFNPGYLMRNLDKLPKRGATPEWQNAQDYMVERELFPAISLTDEVFQYR